MTSPARLLARSLLPIAFLAALAPSAFADPAEPVEAHDNVVLTNVFLYPFGVFNVEYERAVSDRWAIAGGFTGFYSNGTPFDSSLRSRGFGGGVGARYYFTGAAPSGLFASAFLRGFYASIEETAGMDSDFVVGGGAMAGYAHVFMRRLHVSAAAGAHVLWGDVAGTHLAPTGRTLDPEVRVSLGVAF
jgi:hypothetical protein